MTGAPAAQASSGADPESIVVPFSGEQAASRMMKARKAQIQRNAPSCFIGVPVDARKSTQDVYGFLAPP